MMRRSLSNHLVRGSRVSWPRRKKTNIARVTMKIIETCYSNRVKKFKIRRRSKKKFKRKRNSWNNRNNTSKNSKLSFRSKEWKTNKNSTPKTILNVTSHTGQIPVNTKISMSTLAQSTTQPKINKSSWSKNWSFLKTCALNSIGFTKTS